LVVVLAGLLAGVSAGESTAASLDSLRRSTAASYERDIVPLLTTYCAACHNGEKRKGDIDFSAHARGEAAIGLRPLWSASADKLTLREMPPEKSKQPTAAERAQLLAWMASLKRLERPDPGSAVIRRLGRAEYDNTMRDLFGVDLKPAVDFPPEHLGEGLNNTFSPLLMEKLLLAADGVLDQLIVPDHVEYTWPAGQLDALIEGRPDPGKPDGSRREFNVVGEVWTTISLPSEATYTLRVIAGADQAGSEPARLAVRLDNQVLGEVVVRATAKTPAATTLSAVLPAGRSRLSVSFLTPYTEPVAVPSPPTGRKRANPPPPAAAPPAKPADAPKPRVRSVVIERIELVGPPAAVPSPAQRRLFVALPGKDLGKREAAKRIIAAFAPRAFRRPATETEIAVHLKVFDLADRQGESFSEAVKLMLKAVLVSPQFWFRLSEDPPPAAPAADTGMVPVGGYGMASRLSYFLWSTMPDAELSALARDGRLEDRQVVVEQVRRLLKDPKARALVDNFAAPWLGIDDILSHPVDEKRFPQVTRVLRLAMYDEATQFIEGLMREGRSLLDLIDSDYTYLNQPLATLYGIDGVTGQRLQKVALPAGGRGGVLTMGAVLFTTSLPNRTSAVGRGKWVLDHLLGQSPPPPPADVPGLDKQDVAGNAKLSLRQKVELHRADPKCASCHRVMDAIGFGLEGFDVIGRVRQRDDSGAPVDTLGELPGGARFSGAGELKKILNAHRDQFTRTLTRRLLGYALGRAIAGYDEVVVDDIAAAVAKDGYRFDTLVVEVATSLPFRFRRSR